MVDFPVARVFISFSGRHILAETEVMGLQKSEFVACDRHEVYVVIIIALNLYTLIWLNFRWL